MSANATEMIASTSMRYCTNANNFGWYSYILMPNYLGRCFSISLSLVDTYKRFSLVNALLYIIDIVASTACFGNLVHHKHAVITQIIYNAFGHISQINHICIKLRLLLYARRWHLMDVFENTELSYMAYVVNKVVCCSKWCFEVSSSVPVK